MRRTIFSILIASVIAAAGLSQPSGATATPDIVSIGDSIAAGAGLPTAAGSQDALCERSKQAYPYIVADSLNQSLLHLPCYGAKIDEGIYSSQTKGESSISAQLPRAFANGTPESLLVTVGANDLRWTKLIQECYKYSCGSKLDTARTAIYRGDIQYELTRMIGQARYYSEGTPPRIYLSGYYLPFTDASCIQSSTVEGEVTQAEQRWIASQTTKLNNIIKRVAGMFSGVEYVPVSFAGHGACSDNPWVQSIDGNAPLHPTSDGQRAIARSFLKEMRD